MKAVILAAGMGKRLKPLTSELPKAFIPINGTPLIHYSLNNLKNADITSVIIVVGFMEDFFKEKLGSNYQGMNITYVSNKEYATTGSMYSLSQIEGIVEDDIILLESDLLYEPRAIGALLDSKHQDLILVAELSGSGDEVFVCVDNTDKIIDLGKSISNEKKKNFLGELVGISRFSKEFLHKLFKKAEEDYTEDRKNYHYEECVFETSKLGHPVYALFFKDLVWTELDNENDLKRAQEIVYPEIKKS